MKNTLAWINGQIATCEEGYGLISNGGIVVEEGRISWVGPMHEMPTLNTEIIDLKGKLVTPGLIDCHTHLVYAGDRAKEFEQRLQGVSYAEIAQAGGGIQSTVRQTRAVSGNVLLEQSLKRAKAPSLLLMLNMACTLFKLTPIEALQGVTRHAARALGLADQIGTLTVGKKADLCVWDCEHPAELAYRVGFNPLVMAVKEGRIHHH